MSTTNQLTNISQVGTIGVPVNDLDEALVFYRDKLGFEVRMDVMFGPGRRWLEVAPVGASTTIALVAATSDGPAGINTQLRFTTTDAAADHSDLLIRGVDVDPEVILNPVPMFVFRDLDGNRLITVERPQDRR